MGRYIKQCSYCGNEFSMLFCDYRQYVYKVKKDGKFIYQCSYPCYCKELENEFNQSSSSSGRSKKYHKI